MNISQASLRRALKHSSMTDRESMLELRKRWIEALISGKYIQGILVLRSNLDEYCCMGVLCDLVDPNGWKSNLNLEYDLPYYFEDKSGIESGILTSAIQEMVGLKTDQVLPIDTDSYIQETGQNLLVNMNDSDRLSFEEIAFELESNPKKYFDD